MKYLELAAKIALAAKGANNKHFLFGCVALRQDGAIVVSTNVRTYHPMPAAHAEIKTLKKAGHGATLWLARLHKNGQWAMSKPCAACQTMIRNKKVKRVYFTIAKDMYGVWNVERELECPS